MLEPDRSLDGTYFVCWERIAAQAFAANHI